MDCNISNCFISVQWEIKVPEECLAYDGEVCAYKVLGYSVVEGEV